MSSVGQHKAATLTSGLNPCYIVRDVLISNDEIAAPDVKTFLGDWRGDQYFVLAIFEVLQDIFKLVVRHTFPVE